MGSKAVYHVVHVVSKVCLKALRAAMGVRMSRVKSNKVEKLRRELEKRGLSIIVTTCDMGERRTTIVRKDREPRLDRAVTLPCLVEDENVVEQLSEPQRHTWVGPKTAWSKHA